MDDRSDNDKRPQTGEGGQQEVRRRRRRRPRSRRRRDEGAESRPGESSSGPGPQRQAQRQERPGRPERQEGTERPRGEQRPKDSGTGGGQPAGEGGVARRRRRRRKKSRPELRPEEQKPERFEQPVAAKDVAVEPTPGDYQEMKEDQLVFLKPCRIDSNEFMDDLPDYGFPEKAVATDVVGVKVRLSSSVGIFDCKDMSLVKGDKVIVQTGNGNAFGEVVVSSSRVMIDRELPKVIRRATPNDIRDRAVAEDREDAAFRLCKDRIEKFEIPMKLVKVDYLPGGKKAVFYFVADGRVDFRELVRDLAKRLSIRIEMRQIGVRDSTRLIGGVGMCGCQLCCNCYMKDFFPVSIRMAKDQNLVLNPQRVSGICGRLLCCLTYEEDVYKEAAKEMPRVGRKVVTPDGEGRIRDRDVLKKIVRVQLGDDFGLREYSVDQIRPIAQPGAEETEGEQDNEEIIAE